MVDALKRKGIPASIVGEVVPKGEGITLVEGAEERKLEYPEQDPFWPAFFKTVELLSKA